MKIAVLFLMGLSTICSAKVVEQVKKVGTYKKVIVAGEIETKLEKGNGNEVKIKGEEEVLKHLNIVESGGELIISVDDKSDSKKLEVTIYEDKLEEVSVAGASSFSGKVAKTKSFEMGVAGASSADIEVDCQELELNLAGASQVDIRGVAVKVEINLAGASVLNGEKLKTQTAEVSAIGASTVSLEVQQTLNASSIGASTIRYKGSPKVTETSLGASSVSKM